MEALFEEDLDDDSLDLVELIMSLEEEFGIEISEEDWERWRRGELPGDWLNGAPVPRRGPPPTLTDGAEALPPEGEDTEPVNGSP
jgi:hypothetical protein